MPHIKRFEVCHGANVFVGSCLGPPFGAGTCPKKGVENDVPQQLGDAGFDSVLRPVSGPRIGAS